MNTKKLLDYGFTVYHLSYAVKVFQDSDVEKILSEYFKKFSVESKVLLENYILENEPYNILFWGEQKGTGKTTLLHKVALFIWKHRQSFKLENPPMYFDTITSLFASIKDYVWSKSEDNTLSLAKNVSVLFLDDVDKIEKLTQFEKETFLDLIDYRYRNIKPFFMTANKSLVDLYSSGTIDSAMFSRLKETCLEIELKGIDHRILSNEREDDEEAI